MELFEAIRREYQFGVGTVKGVARKFGVHRRMLRKALADAVPNNEKLRLIPRRVLQLGFEIDLRQFRSEHNQVTKTSFKFLIVPGKKLR